MKALAILAIELVVLGLTLNAYVRSESPPTRFPASVAVRAPHPSHTSVAVNYTATVVGATSHAVLPRGGEARATQEPVRRSS